jgi:hypothetical protein
MLDLLKKNIVVIGVIIAAVAGLYLYSSNSGGSATVTSAMEEDSPISHEVLATLGNLRTIKLDDSLFQDPLFLSLSDFGVTIPPAAAGRRNPFAPVGQGGGASKTTVVSTSTSPAPGVTAPTGAGTSTPR